MAKAKLMPFLDLVIDVFYSIILYSAFTAFPGIRIESFLMLFAVMVMINYWWAARSFEMPKHYIADFYLTIVVMFIFSQWSNYYLDITGFLQVAAILFFVDSLYSALMIPIHKEKKDEPGLRFYFVSELILACAYFIYSIVLTSVNPTSIVLIFLPYLVFYFVTLKKGLTKTKFTGYE